MTLTLVPKIARALDVSSISGTKSLPYFFKLFYEFWGFCVNGTSDLQIPGGFPVSGVNMPSGFTTGSMLMSGTGGFTFAGEQFFHCSTIDFTSGGNAVVGHKLVAWVPGSESNDDGIYTILQVVNSSTLRVNTLQGATPYSASLVPYFDTRTGINFRITDITTLVNSLTFVSGHSLVINLSGSTLVNAGQAVAQAKLAMGGTVTTFAMTWSPSGSWNGSSFTDETPVFSRAWTNSSNNGVGNFTFIAASDFVIGHFVPRGTTGWSSVGQGSGFHVEIPQRLYPQGVDPNPIAGMIWGTTYINTTQTTENYGGGWKMHTPVLPSTGTFGQYTTLVRSPVSEYFPGAASRQFGTTGQMGAFFSGRWNGIFFNPYLSKFYVSDVLLANLGTLGQYSLSRARIRRFRVTSQVPPQYTRMGSSGEWLHVINGVIWPWDNAVLPTFNPSGI